MKNIEMAIVINLRNYRGFRRVRHAAWNPASDSRPLRDISLGMGMGMDGPLRDISLGMFEAPVRLARKIVNGQKGRLVGDASAFAPGAILLGTLLSFSYTLNSNQTSMNCKSKILQHARPCGFWE